MNSVPRGNSFTIHIFVGPNKSILSFFYFAVVVIFSYLINLLNCFWQFNLIIILGQITEIQALEELVVLDLTVVIEAKSLRRIQLQQLIDEVHHVWVSAFGEI